MADENTGAGLVSQFTEEMNVRIVGATLAVLVVFAILRFALGSGLSSIVNDTRLFITGTVGWFFMALMFLFVLFTIFLLIHPIGSIRLGGPEATPSYTYPAYFAMFFAAGIAAGIVNSGPNSTLLHYSNSPIAGGTAAGAVQTTMFHNGISAWAAYIAVAVPIAYYAYNKGAPLRFSTILYPLLGKDNMDSPIASFVDLLAVFATIGGLATTVGIIGNQLLTGVEYTFQSAGVQTTTIDTLIVIGVVSAIFIVSVITGVNRGIRRIATLNLLVFAFLLVVAFVFGPIGFILDTGLGAIVGYFSEFIVMSFGPLFNGGWQGWYNSWSLFFWIWWLSWAPFVGLFVAAISRGRRIRTIAVTALASTVATWLWFITVGGSVLNLQIGGIVPMGDLTSEFGAAVAGYPVFGQLPLGTAFMLVFMLSVVTWVVTSADTATLAVSILATERGTAPSGPSRAFWGLLFGTFSAGVVILGVSNSLQASAIVAGAPIGLVILIGLVGLAKALYGADETDSFVAVVRDQIS